jgi:flagellar hook-basal body complex protein FliE
MAIRGVSPALLDRALQETRGARPGTSTSFASMLPRVDAPNPPTQGAAPNTAPQTFELPPRGAPSIATPGLTPVGAAPGLAPATGGAARVDTVDGPGAILADAIAEARSHEADAGALRNRFLDGDPTVGMHEVLIAGEKAGVAVRYAITMKNRAVEAYREILNTPV